MKKKIIITTSSEISLGMNSLNLDEYSGIDLIQKMINGEMPIPPIAKVVPILFTSVDKGIIKGSATANQNHYNPMGQIHGGFAATVIDTFTGVAVFSMLKGVDKYSTVQLNVNMTRPIPVDQTLYCTGKVISITKNIGVSEATLTDENDKVYAHGTATCLIKRSTVKNIEHDQQK